MRSKELMRFIENPALLGSESVAELEALVKDFPYFQPAHLLLSMASRKWDGSVYQRSLKRAAIVATSRARLFNLIQDMERDIRTEAPVSGFSNAGEELDILKAAELTADTSTVSRQYVAAAETPPKQALEEEIGRQLVSARVEKEILSVPEETAVPPPEIEAASFGDWLSLLKKNNGQNFRTGPGMDQQREKPVETTSTREEGVEKPDEEQQRQKKRAIIDKIIEKNPGLIRTREEQKFFTPEIKAKESLLDNEHLVTETLARIYALQGNISKAIRAYQILSLKNPQKSAYFASLIEELKNNQ